MLKKIGQLTILLLTMTSIAVASAVGNSATVTDAYYADLDGDGDSYDVYAEVLVNFAETKWRSFDYYVTLTLPDGTSYTYSYLIITNMGGLVIHNEFIDHATQPGWYTVDVLIRLHDTGEILTATLDFDPPGGSPGGSPIGGSGISISSP